MKIIVVCGPYRAKTEDELENNIHNANMAARRLWKLGWAVFCPHKNTAHFGGLCDDRAFLVGGLEFIKRADAIYLLKDWIYSEGTQAEYKLAKDMGKKIYEEQYAPYPRP